MVTRRSRLLRHTALCFGLALFAAACTGEVMGGEEPGGTRGASSYADETSFTWGIGEPIVQNTIYPRFWSLDDQLEQLLKLEPEAHRIWLALNAMMSSPNRVDDNAVSRAHDRLIARLQGAGVELIAMDHAFPQWMTLTRCRDPKDHGCIPRRDMRAGSTYRRFLDNYEATWRTLARRFAKIRRWEPGNETNHDPFLKPAFGRFSFVDKAAITTDLMYRAHRGIHAANAEAVVYTPGFAPIKGETTGLRYIGEFLELIYANIESGRWPSRDPRRFFDGVAWHPYLWGAPTVQNWVVPNQRIYDVMRRHGDASVPVLFSEIGNTDVEASRDQHEQARWMRRHHELAAAHFPWLKTFIWFRAFDDPHATWAKGEESFGVMGSPEQSYAWKPSAKTFHALACGSPKTGLFRVGKAIFFSNGDDAYCVYKSWQDYRKAGGPANTALVTALSEQPRCMRFDGACVVM